MYPNPRRRITPFPCELRLTRRRTSWTQLCTLLYSLLAPPPLTHAGGGVSSGSSVQAGPGRVSARAGEAVDVLPEGPTQLLRPRRLPLLLQPAALHQPRHPDARQGHHPRGLLHARQQVECSSGSAQSHLHGWIVTMTTLFTGSCKSRASNSANLSNHCQTSSVRPKQTGAGVTSSAASGVTLTELLLS